MIVFAETIAILRVAFARDELVPCFWQYADNHLIIAWSNGLLTTLFIRGDAVIAKALPQKASSRNPIRVLH